VASVVASTGQVNPYAENGCGRLQILPGAPVVVLDRLTRTAVGRVIEFARGLHSANCFAWTYSFYVPD
jgi:GntR family transcriptional regulator